MNHLCGVLFPAVFVEYSQCHWGCQPPFIFSLSWYRTPQITAMLLWSLWKRRGVLREAPSGTSGWGGVGGQMISPKFNAKPKGQWRSRGNICLFLLLLLHPTGGIGDESHLSILFPGEGRPCLFISIRSICGTAAVGRGCRWQRLFHAFPWQRYSWQAGERAAHTWLINTNNETAMRQQIKNDVRAATTRVENKAFKNAECSPRRQVCSGSPQSMLVDSSIVVFFPLSVFRRTWTPRFALKIFGLFILLLLKVIGYKASAYYPLGVPQWVLGPISFEWVSWDTTNIWH